eukprot:CAMPEP_0171154912 /NCGR_PEP_ID=MMETSP0790-20130122/597_1 /TAXON_ID=2925 /ORGANISM="Alexandrium catenella, Strain OF101" /LENGTH=97 /DNA_ID=CAMNT_0011619051 /DNA_START=72 /DNA_END=362 /DNA_ORIENTATION=+
MPAEPTPSDGASATALEMAAKDGEIGMPGGFIKALLLRRDEASDEEDREERCSEAQRDCLSEEQHDDCSEEPCDGRSEDQGAGRSEEGREERRGSRS